MTASSFSPWPSYTPEEIDAVTAVLASGRVNYWTGAVGREFERRFAEWVGVPHAVALANGTVALDVALKALGIGPGDEVITTPRTFLASASCVVTAGAVPVFADVDPDSQNITAETIAAVLTPRTKAVICVHLAGMPCDMDPIMALADQHGLKVIEDCAQAQRRLNRPHRGLVLLSGQDHDDGRGGRDGDHQRSGPLVVHVVLQGSREELGGRL
jgi:dTDP-4-amino-4,6-dideoxygalactose transaminase